MKWIIYKHTNKINGKSYIGQTCQKKELRWNNGRNYDRAYKFGKAIDKYGWDSFTHEILEDNILTQKEANNREIYYIEIYDSFRSGYNSTKGGDNGEHLGREVLQISTKGNVVRQYCSTSEAERATGILAQNIGACLLGYSITAGGYFWARPIDYFNQWTPPRSRKEKPVICVETQQTYDSITRASEETGICCSMISKCVLRKAITAGGYHWCFLFEYDENWEPVVEKKKGGPTKAIICVETLEIYESITECSILTGISIQNISQNCCIGKRTAKGKHYAYLDEYDENWLPAEKYTTEKRRQVSTRKKAVFCCQTKETFSSATEAGEKMGIDNRLISRCCSGELLKTNGYNFCWLEDYYNGWKPRESRQGQKNKGRVMCVETREVFSTATQACKIKKVNISSLSECLSGKRQTAGGYHWKYVEEI